MKRNGNPRNRGSTPETSARSGPGVFSVEEAIQRFPGEWVIMRIAAYGDDNLPSRGEIVVHARSRARLFGRLARLFSRSTEPGSPRYYLFQANPRARTGDAMLATPEQGWELPACHCGGEGHAESHAAVTRRR